jgi:hypothetical protein
LIGFGDGLAVEERLFYNEPPQVTAPFAHGRFKNYLYEYL